MHARYSMEMAAKVVIALRVKPFRALFFFVRGKRIAASIPKVRPARLISMDKAGINAKKTALPKPRNRDRVLSS